MGAKNEFPGGVWPVMLTPFRENGEVDYDGMAALVEWYIEKGASGLFAIAQSGEMFFLNQEERVKLAAFVKERAAGRVPVIAAGHISDSLEEQAEEITRIGATGVDAVILITNRLAKQEESDAVWLGNMETLLGKIPGDLKLGLYECPYPYKRLMSEEVTKWCAESGRFYFLKDTSCDIDHIRRKLEICQGSHLKLYNANTATLLESLRAGAAGYSGIMAAMQGRLYAALCDHFEEERMDALMEDLTICALIERQWYPVNAKYYLGLEGLPIRTKCRVQDENGLTETFRKEMKMLRNVTARLEKAYL